MKRLTAFIIVALMCCAVLLPVSAEFGAADIYHAQGSQALGDTTFTYGINRAYTVSIPESITLQAADVDVNATATETVEATGVYLPRSQKLQIKLSSENTFNLKNEGAKTLEYKVATTSGGTAIANEAEILACAGGTASASTSLYFKAELPSYTGNYQDMLTFRVAIVDI